MRWHRWISKMSQTQTTYPPSWRWIPRTEIINHFTVYYSTVFVSMGFPGGSGDKESAAMWEIWVRSLSWEDPLEEGMATHTSILAWRMPMDRWASLAIVHGGHKVRCDWATKRTHTVFVGTVLLYQNTLFFFLIYLISLGLSCSIQGL